MTVFVIEFDIRNFIAKLLDETLKKTVMRTTRILAKKSVSLLDILIQGGFHSFCSQLVRLEKVFVIRLWDFVNEYP